MAREGGEPRAESREGAPMVQEPMELGPRRLADVVVLVPVGRVDHAGSEPFREALVPHLAACAAGQDRIVLDLSGLQYISSAGLRVLILALKDVKARGGTLVVAALRPLVREIFEISRFDTLFDVHPSVRAALEAVSPAALAALDRG